MDQLRRALFHGNGMAHRSLSRHRRRMDCDHRFCNTREHRHRRLEHAAQGHRLGIVDTHGRHLEHSDAFETGKDRSVAGRRDVAADSSFHGQSGLVFLDHRVADLRLEADVYEFLSRRYSMRRVAAVINRRWHESVDHRHGRSHRVRGLVFSLSGRLAYACLLYDRRQRFLLPAHAVDQPDLCSRLYYRASCGYSVLEIPRTNRLIPISTHGRRQRHFHAHTQTWLGLTSLSDNLHYQKPLSRWDSSARQNHIPRLPVSRANDRNLSMSRARSV